MRITILLRCRFLPPRAAADFITPTIIFTPPLFCHAYALAPRDAAATQRLRRAPRRERDARHAAQRMQRCARAILFLLLFRCRHALLICCPLSLFRRAAAIFRLFRCCFRRFSLFALFPTLPPLSDFTPLLSPFSFAADFAIFILPAIFADDCRLLLAHAAYAVLRAAARRYAIALKLAAPKRARRMAERAATRSASMLRHAPADAPCCCRYAAARRWRGKQRAVAVVLFCDDID